jgi:hypothetical protein
MAVHPWESGFLILALSVGAWWTFLYFRFAYSLTQRLARIEAQQQEILSRLQAQSPQVDLTPSESSWPIAQAFAASQPKLEPVRVRREAGLHMDIRENTQPAVSKSWANRQAASNSALNYDQPAQHRKPAGTSSAIVSSLNSFIQAWQDNSFSPEQKRFFEQSYQGVPVSWRVRIHEVNQAPDGRWMVTVRSSLGEDSNLEAVGFFDERFARALSILKKGQVVQMRGQIDQFFVVPMLSDCELEGFAN